MSVEHGKTESWWRRTVHATDPLEYFKRAGYDFAFMTGFCVCWAVTQQMSPGQPIDQVAKFMVAYSGSMFFVRITQGGLFLITPVEIRKEGMGRLTDAIVKGIHKDYPHDDTRWPVAVGMQMLKAFAQTHELTEIQTYQELLASPDGRLAGVFTQAWSAAGLDTDAGNFLSFQIGMLKVLSGYLAIAAKLNKANKHEAQARIFAGTLEKLQSEFTAGYQAFIKERSQIDEALLLQSLPEHKRIRRNL